MADTTFNERSDVSEILDRLARSFKPISFIRLKFPKKNNLEGLKVSDNDRAVLILDEILKQSRGKNWRLSRVLDKTYCFNGQFWELIDDGVMKEFLTDCAENMGVIHTTAKSARFSALLFEQFRYSGFFATPKTTEKVKICLKNGVFTAGGNGFRLVNFNSSDFITYQLDFDYDKNATAPIFDKYLSEVLPSQSARELLAEYCGYLFVRNGYGLKMEKCLMLYGGGSNGKSVFFEVLTSLLGRHNVSSFSLEELLAENGYARAEIVDKVVNYGSEIGKKMNADLFKRMVSGEAMSCRVIYGKPTTVTNYAKFIFNANKLPSDVEQTEAYFRRFIIIPFDETIKEENQDKELHTKIINGELSGVFNWVVEGLKRLLTNKKFTYCDLANKALQTYKTESDTVIEWAGDVSLVPDNTNEILLSELYPQYKDYAKDSGYHACGKKVFAQRLVANGFQKITSKYTYICCRYGDVDVVTKTTEDEENVQEGFLY